MRNAMRLHRAMPVALTTTIRRNIMKLDKKQAIARRNQELGGAVLGTNNTHFATLNTNKNIWWFDLPVPRLAVGQYEWVHLRNKGQRKSTVSLELSADKDSYLKDVRPLGANLSFAHFLQN
jgi:hypothetical protein